MGPDEPRAVETPPGYVDHVERMREFLARHPEVTWLAPASAWDDHGATWIEADPDPAVDGQAVRVARYELRDLVDYLEARFR